MRGVPPLRRRALLGATAGLIGRPACADTVAETVALPGGLDALVARPVAAPSAGLVVLADEETGRLAQLCRRLADGGYLVVAPRPDFTAEAATQEAPEAGARWLRAAMGERTRLGLVGFGAGGSTTWRVAARAEPFAAAVAWSGRVGSGAELAIPLLGLYGADDLAAPRTALLRAEASAASAKRTAEMVRYAGAGPDFAEGRTPAERAAADDGWARLLAWFRRFGVG